MSTPARVHVGDTKTEIILDCGTDVSSLTSAKILYQKPNGVTGSWTATKKTGAPTKIHYITGASDLDVAGVWILQAYVVMPAWSGHGEEVTMRVYSTQ